jgi:site-specific recombinase XerC
LCEKYGHESYAELKSRNVKFLKDRKIERSVMAKSLMKALRQVFKWAIKAGHVETNPVPDIETLDTQRPDDIHSRTTEES